MNRAIRSLAIIATLAAFGAASADEFIQNNNFGVVAGTLDHWITKGDFYSPSDGSDVPVDFISASSQKSHSTRFSAKFGIENFSGSNSNASMEQDFGPVAGSGITSASAWIFSYGQDMTAYILYSDNSNSHMTQDFHHGQQEANDPDQQGWEFWNLTSLIDTGKTVTGIKFAATAGGFNQGNNIFVDDVHVVGSVPEPGTYAVLGLGVLGVVRRRKARKA